ncbi:hypothetical protein JW859_07505 [bacterium]|nr:hypothetical protein [bacterium]
MTEGSLRGEWRNWRLALLAALILLLPATSPAQQPERVEEVGIRLEFSDGFVGPETLTQLEDALQDVVEFVLLDNLDGNLADINHHLDYVVDTLGGVIDRELREYGFVLEEMLLEPDRSTQVTVKLHLAEQRVNDFQVRFYLLGNTPVLEAVTAADEEAVAAALYTAVARTPYSDENWLSGLVTQTVEHQLAKMIEYAGFTHTVLVHPGQTTTVAVTLTPRAGATLLTNYSLSMRSQTLPLLSLQPLREEAAYYLQSFNGAPLGFIEAKLAVIEQAVYQQLINSATLAPHCADLRFELVLSGCSLVADLRVDSTRYMLDGEARLALWDYTVDDLEGRITARAGVMLTPQWSAFALGSYYPAAEDVYPAAMAGLLVDYGLVAAGYDFEAEALRLLGQVDLAPRVYLAGDVFVDNDFDNLSEISVHYRVRDLYELQLISNLDGEVVAAIAANF